MTQGNKVRITQIDSLKFFLIFSVLVIHCLGINKDSGINGTLFKLMQSFVMPVFVILSGMMFRNKNLKELLGGGGYSSDSYLFGVSAAIWRETACVPWRVVVGFLVDRTCL